MKHAQVNKKKPMSARIWETSVVDTIAKSVEGDASYSVERDEETITIIDIANNELVLEGIQQYTDGPWVIRYDTSYFEQEASS